MSALLPAGFLLLWSGVAATLFASLILAPALGEPAAVLSTAPREPSLLRALLLGTLGLPLLYGLGFLILAEANLLTGAFLGLLHAAILSGRSFRNGGVALLRDNLTRSSLCVVYGAVLGFAYVTP